MIHKKIMYGFGVMVLSGSIAHSVTEPTIQAAVSPKPGENVSYQTLRTQSGLVPGQAAPVGGLRRRQPLAGVSTVASQGVFPGAIASQGVQSTVSPSVSAVGPTLTAPLSPAMENANVSGVTSREGTPSVIGTRSSYPTMRERHSESER